ncbi:hypothetical protein BJF78_25610 [Pseudonocardia sp. CNS-139]|nr:hypothetical protein BJF78_25610 [Pseudonocardia sp. CNS-139]
MLRRSRRPWLVPLALAALLTLAGCATTGGGAAGPAEQDLHVALGALPSSGDPDVDSSLMASAVYDGIYDPLVKLVDGQLVPALATEWTAVDDLTWDITLRENVRFSDGSDWTAEVAAWNLTRTLDPATKSTRATGVAGIASVEAVGPTLLRIHTKRRTPA